MPLALEVYGERLYVWRTRLGKQRQNTSRPNGSQFPNGRKLMERIKALMGTFTPSEINLLENYLGTFEHKGQNRQLDLFHLMLKKPDITPEEASEKIYGETSSKAFMMTKGRLYERMLEITVLSQHFSPGKAKKYSAHLESVVEMRKNLLFATQIRSRGLKKQSEELLRKVVARARETGHPEFEIDALFRLRAMNSQNRLARDYYELSSEINRSLRELEQDLNWMGLRELYAAKYERLNTTLDEKLEFLEGQLPEAEEQLRQHPSTRARYSWLYLKVRHYALLKDHEKLRRAIQDQIQLLEEHPALKTDFRMANPLHQWARLEMRVGNYEKAVELLQKAKTFFRASHTNYYILTLAEIAPRLHQRELEVVKELLDYLARHPAIPAHTPPWANMRFYAAAYYYYLGDQPAVRKALRDTAPLQNPKSGWFSAIRVFEIMMLIESDELDFASSRVESLRKYLGRYGKDPRMKVIYKVLKKMELKGFVREPVAKEAEFLRKLREEVPWDPAGVELVRFEEWYLGFVGGK